MKVKSSLLPLVCAGLVLTACTNDSSGGEQGGPPLPEPSASATPTPSQSLDAKAQAILAAAKKAGITVTGLPRDPQQRELALIAVRYKTLVSIAVGPAAIPDEDIAEVLDPGFRKFMVTKLRLEENQGITRRGPIRLNFGQVRITANTAIVQFCADNTQNSAYSSKSGKETIESTGGISPYSYPLKKIDATWKITQVNKETSQDACVFN